MCNEEFKCGSIEFNKYTEGQSETIVEMSKRYFALANKYDELVGIANEIDKVKSDRYNQNMLINELNNDLFNMNLKLKKKDAKIVESEKQLLELIIELDKLKGETND